MACSLQMPLLPLQFSRTKACLVANGKAHRYRNQGDKRILYFRTVHATVFFLVYMFGIFVFFDAVHPKSEQASIHNLNKGKPSHIVE